MLKVTLFTSEKNFKTGKRLLEATVQEGPDEGRRFYYAFPDGKPREGDYLRELDDRTMERLMSRIQQAGFMIDETKPCWYECDPVYGSLAYQRLGIEQHWAERERVEANW